MDTATVIGDKSNTSSAECTARLRWVPKSMITMETKLQQAWQITYYDKQSQPWLRDIEWRDVPTEMHPRS